MRFPVSRPLVSAFASAFFRRPRRNSADLTGHLARETPNCFPIISCQHLSQFPTHNPISISYLRSIYERTLRSTSSSSSVSSHGNGLLMFLDVLEELDGALKFPAVDGLSRLAGVLEGNSEVCASGFCRFTGVHLCCCVSDLYNISISPLSSRSSFVDLWYCEVSVWDRPDCSSTQRYCRKHFEAFCPHMH